MANSNFSELTSVPELVDTFNNSDDPLATTLKPPQEAGGGDEVMCGWCYFSLVIVILFTMYGNLMVCLAVMFDKRLQNITNYFLVSLAMTDMAVAILVMPFAIVVAYNNGKFYQLS